jgi:DNA polymerase III alpha subunit
VNAQGEIMLPLTSIKGVGVKVQDVIMHQPFESLKDMCWRTKANRGMVQALAEGEALDIFPEVRGRSIEEIMENWDELVKERIAEEKRIEREKKMRYKPISPMHQMADSEDGKPFGGTSAAPARLARPARQTPPRIKGSMSRIFSDDFFGE